MILASGILTIYHDSSFGAIEFLVVMRMIASLSGYFGLEYSPMSRLIRSNAAGLLLLALNVIALFLGM